MQRDPFLLKQNAKQASSKKPAPVFVAAKRSAKLRQSEEAGPCELAHLAGIDDLGRGLRTFDATRQGKDWFGNRNACDALTIGLALGIGDSEPLEVSEYPKYLRSEVTGLESVRMDKTQ